MGLGGNLPTRSIGLSQSLPNQVNDFNCIRRPHLGLGRWGGRNPFQTRSTTSILQLKSQVQQNLRMSQSLPNQVNDFNTIESNLNFLRVFIMSQSLPNQVNDFNKEVSGWIHFSQEGRNPFQTRSTTSIRAYRDTNRLPAVSRNPFQTRSTTSIRPGAVNTTLPVQVAIPSKPGQRLQLGPWSAGVIKIKLSQSLPNQVNDFNSN